MFKALWRLLLMFNGVSSEEDERRAAELRALRAERLREAQRLGREPDISDETPPKAGGSG